MNIICNGGYSGNITRGILRDVSSILFRAGRKEITNVMTSLLNAAEKTMAFSANILNSIHNVFKLFVKQHAYFANYSFTHNAGIVNASQVSDLFGSWICKYLAYALGYSNLFFKWQAKTRIVTVVLLIYSELQKLLKHCQFFAT